MSLASRKSSTSPNQKVGIETATSAVPIAARSSSVRRLIAETIPTGTPARSQSATAPTVSDSVAGSRSVIRLSTEAPE